MQAADWHKRYQEQAQWTKPLRRYILAKLPIQFDWEVCELGCSTGAILQDFSGLAHQVIGLDIDLNALLFQGKAINSLVCADATYPPFQENTFDLVFCHYFLLWLKDPVTVIKAARRLLKPGAYLAVFAEPNYASRRTSPDSLKVLADLQNQSLAAQGANLEAGRNLGQLLSSAGFSLVEFGPMKEPCESPQFLSETEKQVLREDWEYLDYMQEAEISKQELEGFSKILPERWYVPTYYALAKLNQ